MPRLLKYIRYNLDKGECQMSTRERYIKVIESLVNGEEAKASDLLHEAFVEKAREIWNDLVEADEVVEDEALNNYTLEKAMNITKKSALTLKIGKEAFYKQSEMSLCDAYDYASSVMVENMLKKDAEEGIDAFINKRVPHWEDK